ncbi:MAG TPA: hypothetical protein VM074_05085 [Solimonas sp.]|nr:hypothetical protein [Solimonas sp.]
MDAQIARSAGCVLAVALIALSMPLAVAQAPADATEESQPLPPIEVTGQQSPFDAQRAKLERNLPCIGDCDAPSNPVDNILATVLGFIVLPAADTSRVTPVSLRQPTKARLDDKLP